MQTVKTVLAGHKVSEIMRKDLDPVPAALTLQDLVDHHILGAGKRYFIVEGERGRGGLVTVAALKEVPRPAWPATRVDQVMIPQDRLISIPPDEEIWAALEEMGRDGVNQLPVVENGGIVGIVSREDVLQYLTLWRAFGR
jgi:CBS domain-containing protein